MNISGQCVKFIISKITPGKLFNKHHFCQQYTSFRQLKTTQTMKRCAPGLPYVHKVGVSQESIQTKGRIIDFEISVIDTHPGSGENPTVVGVHGIPGSATDFEPCIHRLAENNVRFIGPTFPGSETSEIDSWKLYHLDYSCNGLASIVLQVLDKLGVDRVSMVMCHSAGAWVGYNLAAQTDRVKSLCLFNAVGGRPHRTLRPQFAIHLMAWLLCIERLHFFVMPLLAYVYNIIGFSGVQGGDHLTAGLQSLSRQDFEETRQHARQIQQKQLPLLFAYTLNDKIIERDVYEEMLFQHLKVPESLVTRVDAQRNQMPLAGTPVDPEPSTRLFVRGLQFERGGHIAHKAYNQIVMHQVLQLLHHVENDRSLCDWNSRSL